MLTSVVSITEGELAVLAAPAFVAPIQAGVAQMKAGLVKPYTPEPIAEED